MAGPMESWLENRWGRFYISRAAIERDPMPLLKVFGMCLIVKAEMDYATDSIHYTALSGAFHKLSEGEQIPVYEWVLSNEHEPKAILVD